MKKSASANYSGFYGNWKVLSPQNILIFRCDEKRKNWYVSRNLAEIIEENTIRLSFEPAGLGNHGRPFGLEPMQNICVNCGSVENLTKHHVVPRTYRKLFPIEWKSRNFHDVLLLCLDCHHKYEEKAVELKKELGEKYKSSFKYEEDDFHKKIRTGISYCKLILNGKNNKIPKERISEMYSFLLENFGENFFDYMDKICILDSKLFKSKNSHSISVIESFGDIQEFIELWRNHFIENMDLKYLPKGWSIKNKIKIKN